MDINQPVIEMKKVCKTYFISKEDELKALSDIDLKVYSGEFLAIVGASGSGKSTLMNIVGLLDRPTEGEYLLDGTDVSTLSDNELSHLRNKSIGFVFQNFNLISRTTALKNVALPMIYAGKNRREANKRAKELLGMVDMTDRMHHQPNELSGGQKQRTAIARSIANDPSIILADEPTGALDSATGRAIMDMFHKLHREQHKTIVLITHSPELAGECQRIITLKDGRMIREQRRRREYAAF